MMLRTLPRSSRRAAGFTLIELLVAVALLAILAVLSWRGLDAVIQSRERLVTESDELRSLTLALAQLEEDLLGTWPVKNLGGGIRPIRVVQDQGGAGGAASQSMMLVREIARTGRATRLQRVVYQVRDGRLERGFSEWQHILMDVRAMRVRGWVNNSWMGGSQLQAYTSRSNESGGQDKNDPYGNSAYPNLPAITPTTPPEVAENIRAARRIADEQQDRMGLSGIEVLIERTNGQRFLRIYSIRD